MKRARNLMDLESLVNLAQGESDQDAEEAHAEFEKRQKARLRAQRSLSILECFLPIVKKPDFHFQSLAKVQSNFHQLSAALAIISSPSFKDDVPEDVTSEYRAGLIRVDAILASTSFQELAQRWPNSIMREGIRASSPELEITLMKRRAAVLKFIQMTMGTDGQRIATRCAEWLDSLDAPSSSLGDFCDPQTQKESLADQALKPAAYHYLEAVFRLKDVVDLVSVAQFQAAFSQCATEVLFVTFPYLKPLLTWSSNLLTSIAAATTMIDLGLVYSNNPFDYDTIKFAFVSSTLRARLFGKIFKIMHLAFHARLEELAGNIKVGQLAAAVEENGGRRRRQGFIRQIPTDQAVQCAQQ